MFYELIDYIRDDGWIKVIVENYTGIGDYSFRCTIDPDKNIECLKEEARSHGGRGDVLEEMWCFFHERTERMKEEARRYEDTLENAVFFFRDSILSIDKSFRDYGINEGDRIVMARDRNKIDERAPFTVRVDIVIDSDDYEFNVEVKPREKVGELKRDIKMILCELGFNEYTKWMELRLRGAIVLPDDDRFLMDYDLKKSHHFVVKERLLCLRPINTKCEPIECHIDQVLIFDSAIDAIRNKYNMEEQFKSSIKLFQFPNKTNRIKNDSEIYDPPLGGPHDAPRCYDVHSPKLIYSIYYFIKPKVNNLIWIKELGAGEFGTVYLCFDIDSNTQKALKKFNLESDSKQQHSDFVQEIEVYEKLGDHPRIIKYEKHFQIEKKSFIQMEYMPGGSLASYLRTYGPLPEGKISKYAKQICEGLKHLHDNKILHRDIKGANILIDSNDDIKLSDFGLSKILMSLSSRYFLNAAAKTQVGTINYMAPEVIEEKNFGSAADIWSFGATMVEMVTGNSPFREMTSEQVIFQVCTTKTIDISYPPNSSDQIKSFIDRCLQGDPLQRSTVNELLSHPFLS